MFRDDSNQKYLEEALKRSLDGAQSYGQQWLNIMIPTEEGHAPDMFGYFLQKQDVDVPLDQLQKRVTSFVRLADWETNIRTFVNDWPLMVAAGAELVPFLLSTGERAVNFTAQLILTQLLGHISRDTINRVNRQGPKVLCDHCFTSYTRYQANLSWMKKTIDYYGCRLCRRSRAFVAYRGKVAAVLDNRQAQAYQLQDENLEVNWLALRHLFDFDEIRIIQATDEDVERFAVQIGNDADPFRQPRFKGMSYHIAPDCQLSESTKRVIERVFEYKSSGT